MMNDIVYKYYCKKYDRWDTLNLNGADLWMSCLEKFKTGTNIRMYRNGKLLAVIRFSPHFDLVDQEIKN